MVVATCVATAFGGVVWAGTSGSAPLETTFDVKDGVVLPAKGVPMPRGGTHVGMYWNRSTVSKTVQGPGRVVMTGVGSWCEGWPVVQLTVDGKIWWRSRINSHDRYGRYPMGPALPSGSHRIAFQMVNDTWSEGGCDRNAFLADAWVQPVDAEPSPAPSATPAPSPRPTPSTSPRPTPSPTPSPRPSPTPAPSPTPSAPPTSEPAPSTASRPDASNTGVPDGTKLRVHDGDLVIREDGAVIDGLDVRGFVDVQADGVTIKNTLVRGGHTGDRTRSLVAAHSGQRGLKIVDSTLRGEHPTRTLDGLKGKDFTAVRLDVSNVVDTVMVTGSNVLLKNSWLHDNVHFESGARSSDGQTHDDNVQIEAGSNVVLDGNRLEGADNAAVMVTQNAGRTSNLLIVGNLLSGGSCTINMDDKGKGAFQAVDIKANQFGPSAHHAQRCPMRLPRSGDIDVVENVWQGTTTLATANEF